MADDCRDLDPEDLIERALDLVLYAPLGLALESRRLFPELAARGRRQIELSRLLGKMTVETGLQRQSDETAAATPPEPSDDTTTEAAGADPESSAPAETAVAADPSSLAIADYDSLAASQVVPLLSGLDVDDLEAIRGYEAANRGRRTILGKIARLQA